MREESTSMFRDYQNLKAEVTAAKHTAGDFCKAPFDGSLTTAILAISMRACNAEKSLNELRETIRTFISDRATNAKEERMLQDLLADDSQSEIDEQELFAKAYREFGGKPELAQKLREIAILIDESHARKRAQIPTA